MRDRCPRCDTSALVTTPRGLVRRLGNRTFTKTVEIRRCEACDFSPIPVEAVQAFETSIATELALFGPANNETFHFLRRATGLDPDQTARALDVPLDDVLAWEHRRRKVPRASWFILARIVRDLAAEGRGLALGEVTVNPPLAGLASTSRSRRELLGGTRLGVA